MSVKLSSSDDEAGSSGEINVVPLIDVLFSILTFFVLASIFLTRQQTLPMDLPKVTDAPQQNELSKQYTLVITKSGSYTFDKKPIALKTIGKTVKDVLDSDPNAIVIVAGDKSAEYRFVVDVLDELRQVNATRIAMAADAE